VSIKSAAANANLTQSIRAAEMIGAGVLLIAFFGNNTPDMVLAAAVRIRRDCGAAHPRLVE
jgi:hypothetical protein